MDNDLVEQFLEHLLRDTDSPASTDPNYHNQLCKLYMKKLIILQPSPLDKKLAAPTPAESEYRRGQLAAVAVAVAVQFASERADQF